MPKNTLNNIRENHIIYFMVLPIYNSKVIKKIIQWEVNNQWVDCQYF